MYVLSGICFIRRWYKAGQSTKQVNQLTTNEASYLCVSNSIY